MRVLVHFLQIKKKMSFLVQNPLFCQDFPHWHVLSDCLHQHNVHQQFLYNYLKNIGYGQSIIRAGCPALNVLSFLQVLIKLILGNPLHHPHFSSLELFKQHTTNICLTKDLFESTKVHIYDNETTIVEKLFILNFSFHLIFCEKELPVI